MGRYIGVNVIRHEREITPDSEHFHYGVLANDNNITKEEAKKLYWNSDKPVFYTGADFLCENANVYEIDKENFNFTCGSGVYSVEFLKDMIFVRTFSMN